MEKKKEEKPEEQHTEPESDLPEALLEFQIETKEETIDQVFSDLKEVEKKNKEYHERNDLLKKEQQALIERILAQLEKEEKEKDEKEVVTRDDVEESLKAKWQYAKDKEQLLKDLCSQIEETKQKLSVKQSERDYWLEYKNVGSRIQAEKIMNLEKDIKEVKDDLHRTTEYYRDALKAVEEENDRLLKFSLDQATENAVRSLDKNSRRVIEENEWLKEEIKMYQKEVSDLEASIQLLQEENISLVTKLIDGKLENLTVPRLLLAKAGWQDEFPKDKVKEVECREYAVKADGCESPRSATVPCQKNKAFARIQSKTEKPQDSDEELREKSFILALASVLQDDDCFQSWTPGAVRDAEDIPVLQELGQKSTSPVIQEYLKLGPLERQLLRVTGKAMPIHAEPEEMPRRNSREDCIGKSDRHITARMIKALSKKTGEN